MNPRIIVVPPSAETGEIARALAPAGYELVLVRGDGAELAAALGEAEYVLCYPSLTMKDAFYQAAPRLRWCSCSAPATTTSISRRRGARRCPSPTMAAPTPSRSPSTR